MSYPFLSVIIPVYNNEQGISRVLDALQQQTYPREQYEIIVIDNGSDDNSVDVIKRYPDVSLLFEHRYKGSPYSARNRGIEQALGDILIFLDSTCVPIKNWLQHGIDCMIHNKADLLGGNIKFHFPSKIKVHHIYESLMTIRVKESIERRQSMIGGNLFVKKQVFSELGKFPEGLRSGGDVRWTTMATSRGFILVYNEHAVVYIKPKSLHKFFSKMWRFGKARPQRWEEENIKVNVLKLFLNAFRPPARSAVRKIISERGQPEMEKYLTRLWLYHFAVKFIQNIGNIYGIYLIRLKNRGRK